MNKRKAFTLMEIIIAMALIAVVILSIFMINKNANETSMDAYYEMLAFSLAREPIEIYRGFGYETLSKINKDNSLALPQYPIGKLTPIVFDPLQSNKGIQYPPDAERFQRLIELNEDISRNNQKYISIRVTVMPLGLTKADIWLSRKSIILDSNIMESSKW